MKETAKNTTEKLNRYQNFESLEVIKSLDSLEPTGDTKVKFKLSVEVPDRFNDTVRVRGINLKNYKNNPVVLWMHDHTHPIGVGEDLYVEDDSLYGTISFHRKTQLSRELADLAELGYLKAVSIGFIPTKVTEFSITEDMVESGGYYPQYSTGRIFEESELLEFSLVSVPANQEALVVNSFDFEEVKDILPKDSILIKGFNNVDQESIPSDVEVVENVEVKAGAVLNKTNLGKLNKASTLLKEVISSSKGSDDEDKNTVEDIETKDTSDPEVTLETEEKLGDHDVEENVSETKTIYNYVEYNDDIKKAIFNEIFKNKK